MYLRGALKASAWASYHDIGCEARVYLRSKHPLRPDAIRTTPVPRMLPNQLLRMLGTRHDECFTLLAFFLRVSESARYDTELLSTHTSADSKSVFVCVRIDSQGPKVTVEAMKMAKSCVDKG